MKWNDVWAAGGVPVSSYLWPLLKVSQVLSLFLAVSNRYFESSVVSGSVVQNKFCGIRVSITERCPMSVSWSEGSDNVFPLIMKRLRLRNGPTSKSSRLATPDPDVRTGSVIKWSVRRKPHGNETLALSSGHNEMVLLNLHTDPKVFWVFRSFWRYLSEDVLYQRDVLRGK